MANINDPNQYKIIEFQVEYISIKIYLNSIESIIRTNDIASYWVRLLDSLARAKRKYFNWCYFHYNLLFLTIKVCLFQTSC